MKARREGEIVLRTVYTCMKFFKKYKQQFFLRNVKVIVGGGGQGKGGLMDWAAPVRTVGPDQILG